ncbi:hypothetical protein [Pseudomonas sp. H3(2019)]|uniref:hypothetical protein n=1 Tax=Pseudomonas sp. H3(2019) TaxID=2598724 RepID=UPI0011910356|nr:hypothetical protein [Pseudomonas sp. H3(2019)]TVT83860.1 hypothetical protein FPT12_11945 [Pseudomonas sp. H3(2019)]
MTAQVTAPQTRAPIPDLDPLTVEPVLNDSDLDSINTSLRFRALIPTEKLLPSDKFYVEIAGEPGTPDGGQYKSEPLSLGSRNPRIVNLKKEVVAFLLGKKMMVTYTIVRDSEDDKTSEPPLELNVLPLPKSELKAALIREAENDGNGPGLDLTGSSNDLTLRLGIWPLIAEKQRCWARLEGKKAGDVDHPLTVLLSEPVDGAWITRGYREVKVPYDYFRALLNGSPLKVIVRVALNQEDDEDQAFDFEERVYTVKNVAEVVKPAITQVTDSKDNLVADKGETTDTTLKLEGTAGEGATVEIFVGTDSKGTVTAEGGVWKHELTELSPGTHEIKAVASGQDSNTWTVKVNEDAVILAITAMTDSKGASIANNWATIDTTVKLKGTVAEGGVVDVYDGAALLGEARTIGTQWEFDASELSVKRYAFKAKKRDGSQPESDIWSVTVGTPYISTGSTPNGERSPTEAVSLAGIAKPDQMVVFYYQGNELTRTQASPNGGWAVQVTLISMFNTFTVGEPGGELRSPSWSMYFDLRP